MHARPLLVRDDEIGFHTRGVQTARSQALVHPLDGARQALGRQFLCVQLWASARISGWGRWGVDANGRE